MCVGMYTHVYMSLSRHTKLFALLEKRKYLSNNTKKATTVSLVTFNWVMWRPNICQSIILLRHI